MNITKNADSIALKESVVQGMQEKKASDILVIDLREIDGAVADFFVVCHGDSSTQVEAISDSIYDQTIKDLKEKPWHQEGRTNAEWVLLDYVDVVAHVFYRESREFYNIEGLWADAPCEKIEDEDILN